jgi:hypothetical protein
MNKEIHWLLMSLNHHLHYLDDADKAYIHIQDMNEEIQMWRRRYAEDQQYSKKATEILCSLETNCFHKRTPLQVYKDFIKGQDE